MRNILISCVSFVNKERQGSEIYTVFAKRLINDVIEKTPYDVLVTPNDSTQFADVCANSRVTIREDLLHNHKTHVGVFNQLLKFWAVKDISEQYDWVLYLDCDAGFTENINVKNIEDHIDRWEQEGYDFLGLRTNYIYEEAEQQYIAALEGSSPHLFHNKFLYYGVNPEWRAAKLPSEHILLIKNDHRLKNFSHEFEKFCYLFEKQDSTYPTTWDMESFEIGISALLAGYNVGEMGWGVQCEIFKVGFNFNNWEKIKL